METWNLFSTDNYIALEATKGRRTNLILFVQLASAGYDRALFNGRSYLRIERYPRGVSAI